MQSTQSSWNPSVHVITKNLNKLLMMSRYIPLLQQQWYSPPFGVKTASEQMKSADQREHPVSIHPIKNLTDTH